MSMQYLFGSTVSKKSLFTGWFQVSFNAILAIFLTCFLHVESNRLGNPESCKGRGVNSVNTNLFPPDGEVVFLICHILLLLACAIGIILGSSLISAVDEENASKLKIWLISHTALCICFLLPLAFFAIAVLDKLTLLFWTSLVLNIFISWLGIWAVNVHREELLNNETPSAENTDEYEMVSY